MSAITPQGPRRAEGGWLSVSAAARALGVSPSTLRLWASEGRVPHVRTAGGHRRFDPEALRQWLARQPVRGSRTPRRGSMQLGRSTDIADVLMLCTDRIADIVETLVEGPAEAAYRRLSVNERHSVVRSWIELLAEAFQTGNLGEALDRAESYGRGHGLAGSSAEVTLGGSLALERGVERALGELEEITAEQRSEACAAMSLMTARVATAWAAAVASRGARTPN